MAGIRLRTRLIAAFIVATILPVVATLWVARLLVDRSLSYSTTDELDRLSRTLEETARRFYQLERDTLRRDALEGRAASLRFGVAETGRWPLAISAFWASGESERFAVSGEGGDHLDFMRRTPEGVDVHRRDLGGIRMDVLSAEFRRTRELVGATRSRDLRRGLTLALVGLIAIVWLASLVPLVFIADRISRPIQQLTAGLTDFAAGDWNRRVQSERDDEVGRAIEAFNRMAENLRVSRDRLVYLAQMSSWQLLARKTAHELKNSLTPIRLTVEELIARQPSADPAFLEQASRIVTSEIDALERRVRAFSEFASEPPLVPGDLDLNELIGERVAFLKPAHPETSYDIRVDQALPRIQTGIDLVKGILTNLLENAAEAAGPHGRVLVTSRAGDVTVVVEVHDSGRGVSEEAARTLFEPTITFKKGGMGLGLSIARKHALLCGGDVRLVPGELGGAGFRLVLPMDAGTTDTKQV